MVNRKNQAVEFVMGTAIKITAVLDTISPDSVQITVEDSGRSKLVTLDDMTQEDTKVWTYIFQSHDSGRTPGTYRAIIKVVKSGKTSLTYQSFDMIDIIR